MDKHFLHAPFERNIPVLMGLLGVWNISFMGYKTRTILPYAEALLKFPAHIQQVGGVAMILFSFFRRALCYDATFLRHSSFEDGVAPQASRGCESSGAHRNRGRSQFDSRTAAGYAAGDR